MAQALLDLPAAEYNVKCTDKLSISAKKNDQDYSVVIQKDKVKITLTLEEYAILGKHRDGIDVACFLLKGQLGFNPVQTWPANTTVPAGPLNG